MFQSAVAVIPAYKPDERIFSVVDSLKKQGFSRLVVVDDGNSPDFSVPFEKLESDPSVTLCSHSCNLGKGRALKTAFNLILAQWPGCSAVCVDCDGQLSAEDAARAAELAEKYPDSLILGFRDLKHTANVPLANRFGNAATRLTVAMLTGIRFSDTQCGLRAYPPEVMKKLLSVQGDRFEFENNTLLEVRRSGVNVVEYPISVIYEPECVYTTTFRRIRDSILIYKNLLSFWTAPVLSFLIASVIWFLTAPLLTSNLAVALAYAVMTLVCAGLTTLTIPRGKRLFAGACVLAVVSAAAVFGLTSLGLSSELSWLCMVIPFFAVYIPIYRRLGFCKKPKITRRV